mgnify:CR=1 FL=1
MFKYWTDRTIFQYTRRARGCHCPGNYPLVMTVAVSGGRESMQKGSWIVRPVMVDVRIGEPVETTGYSLDDRDELIEIVRQRIETLGP